MENAVQMGHVGLRRLPCTEPGTSAVTGEVYRITSDDLQRLDVLEEYPDSYQRTELETPYGSAWVYIVENPPSSIVPIPSGDWLRRQGE